SFVQKKSEFLGVSNEVIINSQDYIAAFEFRPSRRTSGSDRCQQNTLALLGQGAGSIDLPAVAHNSLERFGADRLTANPKPGPRNAGFSGSYSFGRHANQAQRHYRRFAGFNCAYNSERLIIVIDGDAADISRRKSR